MKLPSGEVIMHEGRPYDPAKAHEYYMRTRQLKGRKKGQAQQPSGQGRQRVATPNANRQRAKQELSRRITTLEGKLHQLEELIKTKEAALKRGQEARQNKNKKPTAADKSKAARESKQYRQKHKSELAAKAKAAAKKAGGGSGDSGGQKGTANKPDSEKSIKDLKMLATRVRGQLQAAKAKLSAL